ncbi:hypothetical protein VNO77_09961 [Canavalia gladiata]|uniref:Uncharacterized protein n=1 Tax=Canavalia gladiata TaxID=3824 RepID=A0AAN9QWU8_CANGL
MPILLRGNHIRFSAASPIAYLFRFKLYCVDGKELISCVASGCPKVALGSDLWCNRCYSRGLSGLYRSLMNVKCFVVKYLCGHLSI